MPDVLTESELAAIERFPKDQIQQIPRGSSAFSDQFIYDGTKLVATNQEGHKAFFFGRRRHSSDQVNARRNVVSRKFKEGLSAAQIAREMSIPLDHVRNDINRLNLRRSEYPRKDQQ